MSTNTTAGFTAQLVEFIQTVASSLNEKAGSVSVKELIKSIKKDNHLVNLNTLIASAPHLPALKDPKAPKKPMTSYMLFCAKIRESEGSVTTKDLAKRWKNLDEKDKKKFEKKFEKEKERYKQEKENYVATPVDELLGLDENKNRGVNYKGKRTRGAKKEKSDMPKRGRSAYMYFSSNKDNRKVVIDELMSRHASLLKRQKKGKMTAEEEAELNDNYYTKKDTQEVSPKMPVVTKALGAQWKAMTKEDRATYEDQAMEDKKRYENELNDYFTQHPEVKERLEAEKARKKEEAAAKKKANKGVSRSSSEKSEKSKKTPSKAELFGDDE